MRHKLPPNSRPHIARTAKGGKPYPKLPLDANGQPIVAPMTEQQLRAWLNLAAKAEKTKRETKP